MLVHQTSPLNSEYRGEHPFQDTWDQKYFGFRFVGILEHLRALLAEQPAENLMLRGLEPLAHQAVYHFDFLGMSDL